MLLKSRPRPQPDEIDLHEMSLDGLWRHFNDPRRRPTPQVTIEAVMHSVKARGLAALAEPAIIERLQRCDAAAKAEIERRIAKLKREGRL